MQAILSTERLDQQEAADANGGPTTIISHHPGYYSPTLPETLNRLEIHIPRRLQKIPDIEGKIRGQVRDAVFTYARIRATESETRFASEEKIKILNFLAYFTTQEQRQLIFDLMTKVDSGDKAR